MEVGLVSVIVMTYKKFEYLDINIKSIVNQNYENIELIISDDSSSNFDELKINELVTKYKNRFKNIVVKSNKRNLGTVKNFNNAIKISNGEFIVPLSADDYFKDEKSISKLVDYFNANKSIDICTAKRKVINESEDEVILPTEKEIKLINESSIKLLNSLCKGNFISGASTYYRRKIFDELGFFDERFRLMEDYPFYLKYLKEKKKIGFLDYVMINYRDGGVSNLDNLSDIYLKDWEQVYKFYIENLKLEIDRKTFRISKLDYIRLFKKDHKFEYLISHIKYFDIVCFKILNKF